MQKKEKLGYDDVIGDPREWCHCDCEPGKERVRVLAPLVLHMEKAAEEMDMEHPFHAEIVQGLADTLRAMLICQITSAAPLAIGTLTCISETIRSVLRRYEMTVSGGCHSLPFAIRGGPEDLKDLIDALRDGGERMPGFMAVSIKKHGGPYGPH